MKKIIIRKARLADIKKIIDLQINHHAQNTEKKQKKSQGYVTLLTNSEILKECISDGLVFVAYSYTYRRIFGYVIAMHPFTAAKIIFLQPLINLYLEILEKDDSYLFWYKYKETNHIIYSQILVESQYAGKGIGQRLLNLMEKAVTDKNIKLIVSEVSTANPRSLDFHIKKNKYQVLQKYETADQTFNVIAKKLS